MSQGAQKYIEKPFNHKERLVEKIDASPSEATQENCKLI
jgi:hypothetical protein